MAQYTITLNVNPSTYGYCLGAGTYEEYSAVQIEALANLDSEGHPYNFSRWSDDVTTNPRTLLVTENLTLTAYFTDSNIYTLNIAETVGGTTTGAGEYPGGTQVTITASPEPGYVFDG